MLYDLNITWTPSTRPAQLEATLQTSAALGYGVVALNHSVSLPIQGPTVTNPIPSNPFATTTAPARAAPDASTTTTNPSQPRLPTLLRRATLVLADPNAGHRLSELARAYDLLAVRPTTERAFLFACTSLEHASLISLDLASFFAFHFRPKPVMAAVRRGLRFEVCYGQALRSASEDGGTPQERERRRALFLGNLRGLVRASRGRGLVVSSEALGPGMLRAPADVVNLLAVWGLDAGRAGEAMGTVPRGVVVNEGLRRGGGMGVVNVLQGAGGLSAEDKKEGGEGGKAKGKKVKGEKRKADGEPGEEGQMSKRAARKARKLEMDQRAAAATETGA